VIVTVRASLDTDVPIIAGTSSLISLANLYDNPDPFTPNADGIQDTTQLGVDAIVGELVGSASDNHEYSLAYTFTVRSKTSCNAGRGLTGSEPVTGGSQTVAVTWDGLDASGSLVADGDYAYSARVDLIETHSGHSSLIDTVTSHMQQVSVVSHPECVVG